MRPIAVLRLRKTVPTSQTSDYAAGSVIVPAWATKADVLIIGSGGSPTTWSVSGGMGGGGGGASSQTPNVAVTPSETLTAAFASVVSLKRGGTTLVSANSGADAVAQTGGAGGTIGGVGTTKYAGAAGAGVASGGYGGGAAGVTAAGAAQTGNAPGGNGGSGGDALAAIPGTNGQAYGGGGGGGVGDTENNVIPGGGAGGLIRITWHN